jgi:hypothetical protein
VGAALGNTAVRRLSTEERHARRLATVFFHHPQLAEGQSPQRIEALLPEGAWKSLTLRLLEAARDGCFDEGGPLDSLRLAERLDPEQSARMREVAIDDSFLQGESDPRRIRDDLIGWFSKRQRTTASRIVTRQIGSSSEDALQLLITDKQRQLEERRAALSSNSEPE